MARRENHWIHVGKLKIGHVLYRLASDGKSYDAVKVKSLEVEKTDLKVVHGVHLREGHRKYHANGFLVAMNYPEVSYVLILLYKRVIIIHLQDYRQIDCTDALHFLKRRSDENVKTNWGATTSLLQIRCCHDFRCPYQGIARGPEEQCLPASPH